MTIIVTAVIAATVVSVVVVTGMYAKVFPGVVAAVLPVLCLRAIYVMRQKSKSRQRLCSCRFYSLSSSSPSQISILLHKSLFRDLMNNFLQSVSPHILHAVK